MKKVLRTLLLSAAVMAVLCVGALAAQSAAEPSSSGIYRIETLGGVTLTPRDGENGQITATEPEGYGAYYAEAVKFDVTVESTDAFPLTADGQYVLLVLSSKAVPTRENIVYIDQGQARAGEDGVSLRFEKDSAAYPSALTKGSYYVYLVGDGHPFNADAPAASFAFYQPYTLGDVNGDGHIDSEDALLALQIFVKSKTPTETERLAADVNRDGTVDSYDALQILKYFVKQIESFE